MNGTLYIRYGASGFAAIHPVDRQSADAQMSEYMAADHQAIVRFHSEQAEGNAICIPRSHMHSVYWKSGPPKAATAI
jgi:hypothetical protein